MGWGVSRVVLVKDECGKLAGLGEKGARAWARFRRTVDALAHGETLEFEWRAPRSPAHHRLFFAQIGNLFDSQEQFDCPDKLRQWLTVGAGYCDFVPGPNGRMVALPKSINWASMDEVEFGELHAAVLNFVWTKHARQFLWPQLTEQQTWDSVAATMGEATC